MSILRAYARMLRLAGLHMHPIVPIALGFLLFLLGAFGYTLLHDPIFVLIGLALADLAIVYPYYKGMRVLDEIDENLHDALKQISTTLRSGGTYEMAIREVVLAEYGALSREFKRVLTDLEAGVPFQVALERMADRVPSHILQRTVTILVDAVKAGGGLAQVLEDLAEDAREMRRIMKERKAKTTMQAMFIFLASVVLTPFIIGAILGILDYMVEMGRQLVRVGILDVNKFNASLNAISVISLLLSAYTLLQSGFSSLMVTTIREGKPINGLVYLPFFLLFAYVILNAARSMIFSLLA